MIFSCFRIISFSYFGTHEPLFRKDIPCVNSAAYKRENPRSISTSGTSLKTAATYSPTICSTIGVTKLNFSVRNGKRWNLRAIATWISFSLSVSLFRFSRMNHKLKTQSVQNSFSSFSERKVYNILKCHVTMKVYGQLVMLGFAVSSFTPASYQRRSLRRPSRNLILWPASYLDAFSTYPIQT